MDNEKLKTRFSLKFNELDDDLVVQFANMQSNFNDAVRFLIAQHVHLRGLENLEYVIPSKRTLDYTLYGVSNIGAMNVQNASSPNAAESSARRLVQPSRMDVSDDSKSVNTEDSEASHGASDMHVSTAKSTKSVSSKAADPEGDDASSSINRTVADIPSCFAD